MDVDTLFMESALKEAKKSLKKGEVPVGAVIVYRNKIIAKGHNLREKKQNALLHAEIVAINKACKRLKSWRLVDCTLYVTLEPCPMCAGAIINSRISGVVFGTRDPKAGASGSVIDLFSHPFNHKPSVASGVLENECSAILTNFFKKLRT